MLPEISCTSLKPKHHYCYENIAQAMIAMREYRSQHTLIAQAKRERGEVIADQNYPVEVIALRPKRIQASPLLLLGGMGPLAGVIAFEQACQIFKNSREIVLFQACSLPDRTAIIQQITQNIGEFSLGHQLVLMLEAAIREAFQYIHSNNKPTQVIVLCNTAHYFLPEVWHRLQVNSPKIVHKLQWVSLIESVMQHLQKSHLCQPLILGTSGTRLGRIYSQPLHSSGIVYLEPNESLQVTLMESIYQGVKAFDPDFACQVGEKFFVELLKTQPNIDSIIAGCSEIPCLLEWLKPTSIDTVKRFLSRIEIIDPVQIALQVVLKM
jgi:aspartate racemase